MFTSVSHSAIIAFTNVDIPIVTTNAGTSVNLETGASANTDVLAGGSVNFFFGGAGISNEADNSLAAPVFQPIRLGTGNLDTIDNRTPGTLVSGANTFSTGFGGSGDHIGNTFDAGAPGYIGFSLDTNDFGVVYGWIEVTLNPNTANGTIHSWAFESSGAPIVVGAVPEPTAIVLSAMGLMVCCLRRKRVS